MSPLVTLVLPGAIGAVALLLLRRELELFRGARRGDGDRDLFVYSTGRFVRRLTGIAALLALALTLAGLGLVPPRNAAQAQVYLGLITTELVALVVVPLWDLVETARTARPGDRSRLEEDPTASPPGRTRTPKRRPPSGSS
jgi:hypothetical protein